MTPTDRLLAAAQRVLDNAANGRLTSDDWQALRDAIDATPPPPAAAAAVAPASVALGPNVWGLSDDKNEERWSDFYDTRDEAIASGRRQYPKGPFYVLEMRPVSHYEYIPEASDILERMAENAYDNCGADEWPDLPKSSRAEIALDLALTQWAKEYAKDLELRWYVGVTPMPEKIDAAAALGREEG